MKAFNYILMLMSLINIFSIQAQCLTSKIPRLNWTINSVSSEETVGQGPTNGKAIYCFDGDVNTYWHTQWKDINAAYPHEIVIDLGGTYDVNGVSVLSRSDEPNNKPKQFSFFTSLDGVNWLVQDAGVFSYPNITGVSQLGSRFFGAVSAKKIKMVFNSNYNNDPHIVIAELEVYQETGVGCGATGQNNQQITITSIPKKETNSAPFSIQATSTSNLPLTYSIVSGPATISNSLVSVSGSGKVVVKAEQSGNTSFYSAFAVDSFEVIDLSNFTPVVTSKQIDTKPLQMPTLMPYKLIAFAAIDEPDFLTISKVEYEVNGEVHEMLKGDGHYFTWWTPSAFGAQTVTIRATGSNGIVGTKVLQFNVSNQIANAVGVTFDGGVIDFGSIGSQWFSGSYTLPQSVGAYKSITAKFKVSCPSVAGGCDDWDRVAWVQYKAPNGTWQELFRYVTPYGKACQHSIDVTDYASVLQGNIELRMYIETWGTGGWKLDLDFEYIKGTPDYTYSEIIEVWQGRYNFGDMANLKSVPQRLIDLPENTQAATLRVVTTGHGWGSNNTGNAAEFYHATHKLNVNNINAFTQDLWTNCDPNPDGCTNQYGYWYFDRAGWCPGSIAKPYFYDLAPYIPLDTFRLNYVFQESYKDLCNPSNPNCISGVTCADCNDGYNPHYVMSAYVISKSNALLYLNTQEHEDVQFGELTAYPNPSAQFVRFTAPKELGRSVLTVHDISGSTLKTYFFDNTETLSSTSFDFQELARGSYFVKYANDQHTYVTKLVLR